jgi:hypothetical protein
MIVLGIYESSCASVSHALLNWRGFPDTNPIEAIDAHNQHSPKEFQDVPILGIFVP